MVRVVVDATGGDFCPQAPVEGALKALEAEQGLLLTLAGPEGEIKQALAGKAYDAGRLAILDCPETITNHEHPATAIRRKRGSAIVQGMGLVKSGQADAFVSTGSTGAVLSGAMLLLGRMEGVSRPALMPMLPTVGGRPVILIDCGANVDCKPIHLQQFALMGSAYLQAMEGVEQPRVALLNIGAEAEKGNELTKAVYPLLDQMPIHFTGNIEARDILSGQADVIVTDAFAGNIAMKATEGAAGALMQMLKQEMTANPWYSLLAAMLKPALRRVKNRMDYEKVGGAPLIGVKGCVFKGHGSSHAGAVERMIDQAVRYVQRDVTSRVAGAIDSAGVAWHRGEG
nr:phosphate acyltransferase PlsX [bacterium]